MRTARFTLDTPDPVVARSLLREWSERLAVTILRARVSTETSHYELQIRGACGVVARALRQAASQDRSARLACST